MSSVFNLTITAPHWRKEKDQLRHKMSELFSAVPNFICLLDDKYFDNLNKNHAEYILEQENADMTLNKFQYNLELVRCNNLIIFLLYFLHRKREALHQCETVTNSKSIIFLTLKAVLQRDLGLQAECWSTIEVIENLYKEPDYQYLCAVAESEKGYVLIRIGPKGFIAAMDCLRKAIEKCSNSDIFLWKYDLALVIRRNFNIHAYSEHPKHSASGLAEEALNLLLDMVDNCPNRVYQARGLIELARLVDHMHSFSFVCNEQDRVKIKSKFEGMNVLALTERALSVREAMGDYYILRESGRIFMYARNYRKAIGCFQKADEIRQTSILYHLWGKTYLYMFTQGVKFIDPRVREEEREEVTQGLMESPQDSSSLSGISDVNSSEHCCWFDCPNGECPITEWPFQAQQLSEELNQTCFMTEDGQYKTTQPIGIGVFRHLPSSCSEGQCQSAGEGDDEEAIRLQNEFDDNLFISKDGSFKTTQEDGIGNIRIPHFQEQMNTQSRRRNFNKSQSFPPEANCGRARCGNRKTSRLSIEGLLKVRQPFPLDESDRRVQEGMKFYKEAEKINPRNFNLLYDMALLYEGINQIDPAIKLYERIIDGGESGNLLIAVNALERCGLACLAISKESNNAAEKEKLKKRAEDLFMTSLILCRQAVAHLPKVNASRAEIWTSYTEFLSIISRSDGDISLLRKEAEIHEVVGKYLEAIEIYQKVLEVARTDGDREGAIVGCLRNLLSLENTTDAKFMLDLFLTSDLKDVIIAESKDGELRELNKLAAEVYRRSAIQALKNGNLVEACSSFRTALLCIHKIKDKSTNDQQNGSARQGFDISIFCEDEDECEHNPEKQVLLSLADICGRICSDLFGMRVSVNDQQVQPGQLSFANELQTAQTAHIVLLAVLPAEELSNRMTWIHDVTLQSHDKDRVLLVTAGSHEGPPHHSISETVGHFNGKELLPLAQSEYNYREHQDVCCNLFNFICR